MTQPVTLSIIDSHTEGEPTRAVVEFPHRLEGTALQKRERLRTEFDWMRTACLNEPRGFDAIVGAFIDESSQKDCVASVVFFNNVGYLNGCIHGTLGVAQTLLHMGKIGAGAHGIETPVGRVVAHVDADGKISVANVRSFRHAMNVEVNVPGYGVLKGDVAWGGNWFFLAKNESGRTVSIDNAAQLVDYTLAIRQGLEADNITGAEGGEIDHIEIFDPPSSPQRSDSRNFVLCPGGVYDRSPCGTGTSAKMACLHASGELQPGTTWRQAGILDTVFYGSVEEHPDGGVVPTVSGRAFVNAETKMILDPNDPFRYGIK